MTAAGAGARDVVDTATGMAEVMTCERTRSKHLLKRGQGRRGRTKTVSGRWTERASVLSRRMKATRFAFSAYVSVSLNRRREANSRTTLRRLVQERVPSDKGVERVHHHHAQRLTLLARPCLGRQGVERVARLCYARDGQPVQHRDGEFLRRRFLAVLARERATERVQSRDEDVAQDGEAAVRVKGPGRVEPGGALVRVEQEVQEDDEEREDGATAAAWPAELDDFAGGKPPVEEDVEVLE